MDDLPDYIMSGKALTNLGAVNFERPVLINGTYIFGLRRFLCANGHTEAESPLDAFMASEIKRLDIGGDKKIIPLGHELCYLLVAKNGSRQEIIIASTARPVG